MDDTNKSGSILITSMLVLTVFALCVFIFFSCVTTKKAEPKTYTLREVEGEPVMFNETWSFVIQSFRQIQEHVSILECVVKVRP